MNNEDDISDARRRHTAAIPDLGAGDPNCSHGVEFDADAARGLSAEEVRRRWPRGWGPCPLGCGFHGIAYASFEHYIAGDW